MAKYQLIALLLLAGTMPTRGQDALQSREPPLAVRGGYDPDEDVERVQGILPAGPIATPGGLPNELTGNPAIVVAAGEQVIVPAGELPTPLVTLNVEGSDVSPSGQAVVYKLVVRNVSKAKAHNVIVKVIPPKNADKVKADPPATHDEAETRWELKVLEPGATRTIEIVYKPKANADEVKIQARVQFDFGRGMVTKVSTPTVSVKKEGPEKLVVGDTGTYRITVTNTGKVTIRDIEVKDFLNKGLVYEDRETSRGTVDGKLMSTIDQKTGERMWTVPVLAPGQSKVLEYRIKARDPGRIGSTFLVKAADINKEDGFDVEVMTANLQIKAEGPVNEKGTVGQAAGYRIVVENKGSAELKNVVVRSIFPPDMKPAKATNGGQPFRDTVQWVFKELKPGAVKELEVGLVTTTPGLRTVQFAAKADKGEEQKASVKTTFAGVSALNWETDVPGTASAGKNMTYRVTVSNTGSAIAKATQLRVDLPANVDLLETTPKAGSGTGLNAKMVIFPPYDIPPGKKTTFVIEVRARAAGEARVVFELSGEGVGTVPLDHRKSTTITGTDNRGPTGPPPALDRNSVGILPPK